MNTYTFDCYACKKTIRHRVDESKGTGFTKVTQPGSSEEVAMCYTCTAMLEARNMISAGQGGVFLVNKVRAFVRSSPTGRYATNWAGTLIFNVERVQPSPEGGMAFWFMGPEGMEWVGHWPGHDELCAVSRTDRRVHQSIPKHEDYIVRYPYEEIR